MTPLRLGVERLAALTNCQLVYGGIYSKAKMQGQNLLELEEYFHLKLVLM